MEKRKLISTIRNLQSLRAGGEPDPAWLRSTRERLLSEIRVEAAVSVKPEHSFRERLALARIIFPHRFYRYVAKPIMVSSIALGMALGGWVTTVSASYGTLPGDSLYGFKLATEKAQVTLASGPEAKTKLNVEFVGLRVDEVAKIMENPGTEKAKRVSVAMQQLKQDISTVQSNLDQLKSTQPEKAVEMAKLVDRKAGEFHAALSVSSNNVPDEVKGEIQEAKDLVADASVKAMAILVETRNDGTADISEEDIKERVGGKITSLSEAVTKMAAEAQVSGDGSASSTQAVASGQALEVLGEARELLDHNDLNGAFFKVIEGTELAKAAETLSASVPTVSVAEGSSSSTPSAPLSLPTADSATSTPTLLPETAGSSPPRT